MADIIAVQTQMLDLGVGKRSQDLTEAFHINFWKLKNEKH